MAKNQAARESGSVWAWFIAIPALFALGYAVGLFGVVRVLPPVVPDGVVALFVGLLVLFGGAAVGDVLA